MTDELIEKMVRDMRAVPPGQFGRWYWYIPVFVFIALGLFALTISFTQAENLPRPTMTRGETRIMALIVLAISYVTYYVQRQRLKLKLYETGLNEIELTEVISDYATKKEWSLLDDYKNYFYYSKIRFVRQSPEITIIIQSNRLYVNVLYSNSIIDDLLLNIKFKEHEKKTKK